MRDSPFVKVCPVCGKEKYIANAEDWTYKRKKYFANTSALHYFCSWTCLRKYDANPADYEVDYDDD